LLNINSVNRQLIIGYNQAMNITIDKVGTMAFSAIAGSGHTVLMDSSPAAGGEDKGPRPMEMLLMGLGGCTAIDVVLILEKSRQEINNCTVQITSERATTDPKVFTNIHVHFIISAKGGARLNPDRVARAIELSAEKYCSASIMLGKTATITHDFEIIREDQE
jgi:putative redox protein